MIARILSLVFVIAGQGFAAETASESETVRYREVVVSLERPIKVTLAIFDQRKFTLRLIDNAAPNDQPRYPDLAGAMQGSGCVAGCNGGFFTRKPFEPFGLMIVGGKSFGAFDPKSWLNALLVLREGQAPTFEASPSHTDRTGISSLLQTGPWLIHHGAADASLDPTRQAKRTFICHDAQEHWALGVCDPCSLKELAVILKNPDVAVELLIEEAINLDGGPSTGLWIKQSPADIYVREGWPVRNYIGVVPRG